jgi:hypothetical protein
MKTRLLAGLMGMGLLMVPLASAQTTTKNHSTMSSDMRRAIKFQHDKDVADARQAQREARHPSVSYSEANRSADRSQDEGNTVKDPGPTVKKDK